MNQAAGNSAGTVQVVGRPFPRGVSGNPSGRPRGASGLASYIKARTDDGQEIADFMMDVMRGDKIEGRAPKTVERMEAARWLADRDWGRAIQQQDVVKVDQHKVDQRWDDYSHAQLLALLDALENHVPTLEIDGEARELDTPPE